MIESTSPSRRSRRKLAITALLLACVCLPIACGGLLAVGILTIGVSLIFTGASPGYALRDPAVTGVTGTAEPTIDLGGPNGPTVDRLIFLGGDLDSPVSVQGQATAVGAPSTLAITLRLFRADGVGGIQVAATTLATASVPIAATTTSFNAVLSFAKSATTTAVPGDIAVITIDVPAGEVRLDTARTRVNAQIFLSRDVPLTLVQAGGVANGRAILTETLAPANGGSVVIPASTTRNAIYAMTAVAQPSYEVGGQASGQTSSPTTISYEYAGAPSFSLLASTTTTATFTLELVQTDSRGVPIGPVLATAGPLSADAVATRLAGFFSATGTSFDLSTTNTGQSEAAFLGLFITNAGPGDLTLAFDPKGFNSSRIVLPGPSVRVGFPTSATIEVSQPDPAFR